MTRLRILHTLCRIHSGGVEQKRALLAKGLGSDRYEHALICQEADGPIPDRLRNAGWTVHEIGLAPGILNSAWHSRAYQIAKAFKPDIVHGAVYEGEALACSIGLRIPDHEAFGRTIQFKGFTLNAVVENELTGACNCYDKLAKPPVSMAPTFYAFFGVKDVVNTLHWEPDRIILDSDKASSIITEWR